MPYSNEYADKSSHYDIVNNPEVIDFLTKCNYVIEPTGEETAYLVEKFIKEPYESTSLPDNIIAIDGSNYEASIRKDIPSTKVGYVKIGNLLIKRNIYKLLNGGRQFVNPFEVAKIKDKNQSNTFVFPSTNVKYYGEGNVRDSFRLALDNMLYNYRSRKNDANTSLRTTLFKLASYRENNLSTGTLDELKIHKCPNCDERNITIKDVPEQQFCPSCNNKIYPSDCLRIWEEVSDSMSNQSALTRFMNLIEHMIAIHYIRIIVNDNPNSYVEILSNLCFFIDGPLAVFGNAAWLHASILKFLHEINIKMRLHEKSDILIIGLQKSGYIYDYFNLINKYIPNGRIYCLEDEVRYKYITFNDNPPQTFGAETYYGQDFLYKTQSGRIFVFNIPYPVKDKKNKEVFHEQKMEINNYKNLNIYTNLIKDFECDLYENAVVPIALAHKYTAISLKPGSNILDLLSSNNI